MKIFQLVNFLHDDADFVIYYCRDILVKDLLFLVCYFKKSFICVFDFGLGEFKAELFASIDEAVSSGMPSEHHTRAAQADTLRRHNFIG